MRRCALTIIPVLVAFLFLTYPAHQAVAAGFTDVPPSFWAEPAIAALAAKGIIHGFPDGSFRPDNSVTRAQFAAMVDAVENIPPYDPPTPTFRDVPPTYWGYGAIEAAVRAGLVRGMGAGTFGPGLPISRQDMAVIVAGALHLTAAAQDLAAAGTTFTDNDAIAGYAVGAVAAVSRLHIMKGLPGGRFDPRYRATRAQAAQVIYGLMTLPSHAVTDLTASLARRIVVVAPSSPLVPGQTVDLSARVYDARGRLLPLEPSWSCSGGTISPAGVFTATTPGEPVNVTASLHTGAGLLQTSVTVQVASGSSLNGPPGTVPPAPAAAGLSLVLPDPAVVKAGDTLTVTVEVLDQNGVLLSADQGRTLTLTVTTPSLQKNTYTAGDTGGTAAIPVSGTLAGTYTVQASANGLNSSAPATFQVEPGPPDHLILSASPSTLVVPGRPVQITAAVVDAYGNPTTATAPATVTVNTKAFGTFSPAGAAVAGNSVLGTFIADGQAGSTTLTLSAPGTPYTPASLTLYSLADPASLTAGKGMWLTYEDWENIPDAQIISTAQADHITHLYVEVAASATGFYGKPALADLLPKVHAAHIALVAWIYTALDNPAQDAALAEQVADFRAPGGDEVDGLAADMEENLNPGNITSFVVSLRQALGDDYLLVAVVYAPQSIPGQTYAAMYKAVSAFNVVAPMDYWHNTPTAFTPAQAAQYVTQSLQALPGLTGDPGLPVEVVGQAYDMFSGDYAPSGAEESAAIAAARAGGAIGYSMYRWGTADAAEWQAFAAFNW